MSSGGGKAKTPTLLNDNLKSKQFLRVLDLISEGPIYGPVDTEHLSSIMLNKTPVTNKNGDISINGVAAAWRNGSEFQEPINGFDYLEATVIVNNEITKETPLVRTVTNREVDRVRLNIGVSSLVKTDSSGNQENSSVQMAIEVKTGNGGYVTQKIVTIGPNKISGEYLEAHVIDAPDEKPFDLRIRRITDDSHSDTLQNGTVWNSYTEITDDRLSYPCSALVGVVIDRDQFKDTPTRNYHMRGIIVDIPDNYDPINRTYNGVWLGGFKKAWTNNPAWLFRALNKNTLFGLAKRVGFVDIDDGRLYALSQYSDQLVSDGYGGKEPRFTLNAYLTSQEKAKAILDKIASSLRGSSVWDGSYSTMLIDMPSDPVALITNSNVVDGKFTRNSTPSSERYNAVIVTWVDPDNGWETSKEYVSDDVSIANDGYKETTIEAFGCTSRGQAYRVGKWLLESSLRETSRITFSMARDAIAFMPADIVEIADEHYIGARIGGRVVSKEKRVITVDADIEINNADTLSMLGANGQPIKYDIDYIDGNRIHLLSEPTYFKDHSPFIVSSRELKSKLYRITNVKEEQNNSLYKISATEHNPNKQAIVDEGAVFEQPINTINGYRAPAIERMRVINVNSETVQTTVSWESTSVPKGLFFEVRVYNDKGLVVLENETDLFSHDFFGLNSGGYFVGVKAKIINGMKGAESQIEMNIGAPPKPTHIQIDSMLFGVRATPYISMDNSINTMFEFWGSEQKIVNVSEIETKAKRLGRGTFWIKDGLKEGQEYWFYVRSLNPFGMSDFVEATGKPDNVVTDILDEIGDNFLSNEAGQQMQEQIDFNQDKVTDLEIDGYDFKQKIISVDREIEAVNEAVMTNTQFTTELHFKLSETTAHGKAEIFRLEQVQANDRESHAKFQQEVASKFEHTAADVLNVQESLAKSNEAFAQQIGQVRAEINSTNEEVGTIKGRVTTVEKATVDLEKAQASFEQSTVTQFGEMRSYITHVETSLTNAEFAFTEALMQTNAQVNETNSELLKSKAEVSRLSTAVADNTKSTAELTENVKAQQEQSEAEFIDVRKSLAEKDKAQSEHTEQVRAELGKDINANKEEIEKNKGELSDISAVVTQNTTAIAETDKTLTEYKQQAQSRFEDNEASINTVQRTLSNIEGSLVESVGQVQAQQNVQGTEILRAKASITRIDKVVADNNHAFAQSIEKLETKFDDVNASITTLKKTVSDSEKAQAEVNELIKSEVGENKSAIELRGQTVFDHKGNGSAIYKIQTGIWWNGQYYDAKFMIGATVTNGKVVTQIGFSADTFGIFNPSSGKLEPVFFVENGQVFINEAFINKATIEKIIVGTDMRSKNYVAGKTGTRIDMNTGTIEINGSDNSGSRMTIKNDQIAVYAGGKPKIVIGRLYGI